MMKPTLTILTVIYASLMLGAVLTTRSLPSHLRIFTMTGALSILLGLYFAPFLPLGLLLLLLAAIANGHFLYGHLHWRHFLSRFLISLLILFLWCKVQGSS